MVVSVRIFSGFDKYRRPFTLVLPFSRCKVHFTCQPKLFTFSYLEFSLTLLVISLQLKNLDGSGRYLLATQARKR